MAYNGKPFFKIPRPILVDGGVESKTLSGNLTLTDKDSLFLFVDGGAAARDITLPSLKSGRIYHIKNTGSTYNLVVKDQVASTIATLTPGQKAFIVCDGVGWYSA